MPAFPDLWEQWPLIEWDFASLNLDAAEAVHAKSFRWFMVRVAGLLSRQGTALNAYFRREDDSTPQPEAPDGQ